ncbi:DNAj domain (prokaryotic heat shock protein)-related [Anaeramoeba flamelloides]|uniref:DNAj domain (Prokaryotic heat shock protein)-related n=1 Tax=Anaeramoeba flamelloides TaxID=1746091 RepID=A0AAV7Y7K9_9EUKA|nr:DNAj domain (prokaryotic heat shock protein)-related [Anaeramoeba flamelloides]
MSQYSFSSDLLSQDLINIKKEFQGITSFRKRLKKLQKVRPNSIIGLTFYDLNKDYLKNKNKTTLPQRIEIRRDCITDLVLLCSKPKKSIERGLATFFKKYYLLKNISNYSREWLVFGPDNENRKKMNLTDVARKHSNKKANMRPNRKQKQKLKKNKNKKQKLKLKHKLLRNKQKKKKKVLGDKRLTFKCHPKRKILRRGKNTKKKSTTSHSLLHNEQYNTSRKRSHHDLYEKRDYFSDLHVNTEQFSQKKINQKSHTSSFDSLLRLKKRKTKNNKIKTSSLKHYRRSFKKKRLNQVTCQKFSSSKLKQKKTKPIKKKVVLCKRYHLFQQKQQEKEKQKQEQEQEQEKQGKVQEQDQEPEQEQEQKEKKNDVQEQEQEHEQEHKIEELQIQIEKPLELFTSPIQDYGAMYSSFRFETDQLEDEAEDFDLEYLTNTRNGFVSFLDDIFEDQDSNLVLFQQDEPNDTQPGFF